MRDAELYREVFGRFATGVAVVTSRTPSGEGGMTANALCSLSLEARLVLVCFENEARTLPLVTDAGRFGIEPLLWYSGRYHAGALSPSPRHARAIPPPPTLTAS